MYEKEEVEENQSQAEVSEALHLGFKLFPKESLGYGSKLKSRRATVGEEY